MSLMSHKWGRNQNPAPSIWKHSCIVRHSDHWHSEGKNGDTLRSCDSYEFISQLPHNTYVSTLKQTQENAARNMRTPSPIVLRHCEPLAAHKKVLFNRANMRHNKWEKWHSWPRVAGRWQVSHSLDRPSLHLFHQILPILFALWLNVDLQ